MFYFRGANLECRDCDKNTPLLLSGKKDHIHSMMFLLEHGADLSAKDKNDRNVFHHIAVEGCLETLKVCTLISSCNLYGHSNLIIMKCARVWDCWVKNQFILFLVPSE